MDTREFWRLLSESRLMTPERWEKLKAEFAGVKGAGEQANAAALAEWLVAQKAITRYQTKILLAGKSGPFVYGDYVVRDRLTSGRLTGLFRAVHAGTRHSVLLHFLTGPVVKDAALYRAAAAHVAAAVTAAHPCLVQVHQLVDVGSFKFIVLEDLSGGPCDEVLAAKKRVSAAVACRLIRQVALGAGALHGAGVAHGEIRPRNIWVDAQGHGRLLQTPLVREAHLGPPTMHGGLSGEQLAAAADYFAPEMARPGQTADALTDVYSMGCTLYELLSGRPPFAGGDAATKMQRHAREAIAPLGPLGVPEALAKVVTFAMAKDRRVRIQSAAQLAEALAPFIDPGKVQSMPAPAATYAAYEAWRKAQAVVPPNVCFGPEERASSIAAASTNGEPNWPGQGEPARVAAQSLAASVGHEAVVFGAPEMEPAAASVVAMPSMEPMVTQDAFMQPMASGTLSPSFAALQRRRRQQRMNALITLAVLLIAGLSAGIVYLAYFRERPVEIETAQNDAVLEQAQGDTGNESETETKTESSVTGTNGEENGAAAVAAVAVDDGKTLWASPTAGEPIELKYLPASVDLVVHVRPAELVRHPEGEKLLAALGPFGAGMRAAVESATGLKLVEMERLVVGWAADEPGAVTLIVRPALISQAEAVVTKWQSFPQRTVGNEQLYAGGGWTYFSPAAEQKKAFVASTSKSVDQIAEAGAAGLAPKLDLLKVARTSDASRMLTILFTTQAVLREGDALFGGAPGQLRSAAEWFFADVRSAALSVHLQAEVCYVEARLVSGVETTPGELAGRYRERLQEMSGGASAHIVNLPLHPYGRSMLIRFPQMVSFLQEQTRSGVEAEQVVLNSYLPVVAAHNLVMGAELALSETGRRAGDSPTAAVAPSSGTSAAEKLKKVTSLMVDRQSFEGVLQQIGQDAGLRTEVIGEAFREAGITRNQSISVALKDKPAGEILREVMLKANPDGKLVYVFKKDAQGEDTLVITTRAMAAKNKEALPPEFAAPADGKKRK
jgi:eukaryotic-like serine/threonine-protein kinase